MDLEATAQLLGNFGEFVAAVAVLITLVYLAIQTKQNTKAVQHSGAQASVPVATAFFRDLYSDPELEDLYYRALGGETLEGKERRRVEHLTNYIFHVYESFYLQQRNKSFDPELWEGKRVSLDQLLHTEFIIGWWTEFRHFYSPKFQGYVAERISEENIPEIEGRRLV
jgi:hypothetical protein